MFGTTQLFVIGKLTRENRVKPLAELQDATIPYVPYRQPKVETKYDRDWVLENSVEEGTDGCWIFTGCFQGKLESMSDVRYVTARAFGISTHKVHACSQNSKCVNINHIF